MPALALQALQLALAMVMGSATNRWHQRLRSLERNLLDPNKRIGNFMLQKVISILSLEQSVQSDLNNRYNRHGRARIIVTIQIIAIIVKIVITGPDEEQ